MFTATISSFAQVQEVKGVATRLACYDNCEKQGDRDKTYGFEYENLNKFAVTIEAEKWRNGFGLGESENGFIAETKTFVLDPGEKYIWKVNIQGHIAMIGKTYFAKIHILQNLKHLKMSRLLSFVL